MSPVSGPARSAPARYEIGEIPHTIRFAGAGGDAVGAARVPGIKVVFGANHNEVAVQTHQNAFPEADHFCGDIVEADITRFPHGLSAWDSPACPPWTDSRGKKRDFDRSNQQVLDDEEFGNAGPDQHTMRMRALMEEIPRNLRHWAQAGKPVLIGVVENVVQCRKWDEFVRWRREIEKLGYCTRLIALNSMHVRAPESPDPPQSRDRLYLAYWHVSLGRNPDWDKWLRPRAHCPSCDQIVDAMQVWKRPGVDMGVYGRDGQYWYRCPKGLCRNRIVEPSVPAAVLAVDWTVPGTPIGERPRTKKKPQGLAPSTIERIIAGIRKHAQPLVTPCGGSWRTEASPLSAPMPTRMTRDTDGLAIPAGWPQQLQFNDVTSAADLAPLPAMPQSVITRNFTARDDGSELCTPPSEHLRTLTRQGRQSPVPWEQTHLLVPYYSNGNASPVNVPVGTLSTKDRYALATANVGPDIEVVVEDVLYRMLLAAEAGRAMAFMDNYVVFGDHDDQMRQYGNAVTPNVAEVLMCALVECLTGIDLDRGDVDRGLRGQFHTAWALAA
ncbi:DNA cytosine methyltransferase [Actinomadura sp. 3N407]|uniref:DNA cytosine methyltransferase n=1 Tax=Actinomadura sp. 3N407 TaxID=3457423 RepID=UPI003FCD2F8C